MYIKGERVLAYHLECFEKFTLKVTFLMIITFIPTTTTLATTIPHENSYALDNTIKTLQRTRSDIDKLLQNCLHK